VLDPFLHRAAMYRTVLSCIRNSDGFFFHQKMYQFLFLAQFIVSQQCGIQGNGATCVDATHYCSKYGWCGESAAYQESCQVSYGKNCQAQSAPVVSTTGPAPVIAPVVNPAVILSNGNCGSGFVCASGCCSQYGWCGTTDDYCGTGCQSSFSAPGQCKSSAAPVVQQSPPLIQPYTQQNPIVGQSIYPSTSYTTAATFFFRVGPNVQGCPAVQTFNDGNSYGPCNGGNGVRYGPQSKYWVAIRNGAAHCDKTITATFQGRSIVLTVKDSCPGCAQSNHLDMGLDALIELTGSREAACAIDTVIPQVTWYFN
jgi:hypothetical protein